MIRNYFLFAFVLLLFSTCKEPVEANNEKEIIFFEVEGQLGETLINSEQATVLILVDSSATLSAITTEISISEKASIVPASGQTVDFTEGTVTYTVTAEDNSTKPWKVSIETEKSNGANILTFNLRRQKEEPIIGDSTVSVIVRSGTDLATLKPEITVSPKASISPASLEEVDFSNGPVMYTVTAENGRTQQWLVSVMAEQIYEANILTFTIPGQIGESVFESANIYIEVPVGYDLTNVTPNLTITEGTTVEPQSGVAVNFAEKGYVDYKVTTEIDSKKLWRVYVTEEVVKPDNSNIQYMGRVDFTNPLKPRLSAPGTAILVKFRGTYCQIIIDDQHLYDSYNNFLEIVVDGTQRTRIQTTGKKNTIDLVKDLPDGEHTLMIFKDTEAGIGYVDFVGLRCEELLQSDPLPNRRIEFIGNSITCGYGVDDSEIACGSGEWYDHHNAYLAYGPEVGRRLNAQWMLTSVSGIGLIQSCCGNTFTMPDVYENTNLSTSGAKWDFSAYQADVVTVCLGQNDGIQDSVAFCSAYVDFLGTVRSKYPNASIVCLTSPMADASLFNSQKNYLTGIVEHMNNSNDSKIYKLFLTPNLNSGCDFHPGKAEQQITANEIEAFLKEKLGW